ncbi:tRNA adenosine(34) deaminase TadA [Bacillus sp. FJAT-49736]|uniref:tRNA adenosine(34) deaminase TadA n=1 Tax=Bacillus sp. FJAT-49736 TaxID=2833582 RepID=UPI001BC94E27|nr:tRNA adenosine(34) deaminase TadA [Bacillus sp. FJAT-49736]MBS4175871.1 tRNA adenosine(34) deaminase TadA [Bacillus sp. FJAT-49736]MBS4175901.1 tRNA adenosine(34) deaminase TadA [Bacillus sp. FJAT-49736]
MTLDDAHFMTLALEEAKKAAEKNEVPIGAVLVLDNEVLASAHNLRESTQNATTHAEILAIQKACNRLGSWRLENAILYVTLEPCPMCSGAIIQSRIKRVVFGAYDPKAGCVGSLMNLLEDHRFNHQCEVTSGVLEKECGEILSQFFRQIRHKKKQEKASGNKANN